MPASIEPRSGIFHGWSLGESGWPAQMEANLLRIGRFAFHLSAKDRNLATPPGTPTAGDTYIVAAAATGAWAGKEGQVTLWDGAAWVFAAPRIGWMAYLEDEEKLIAYKAAGWSAGVAV